jgi:hypothetical protein
MADEAVGIQEMEPKLLAAVDETFNEVFPQPRPTAEAHLDQQVKRYGSLLMRRFEEIVTESYTLTVKAAAPSPTATAPTATAQ